MGPCRGAVTLLLLPAGAAAAAGRRHRASPLLRGGAAPRAPVGPAARDGRGSCCPGGPWAQGPPWPGREPGFWLRHLDAALAGAPSVPQHATSGSTGRAARRCERSVCLHAALPGAPALCAFPPRPAAPVPPSLPQVPAPLGSRSPGRAAQGRRWPRKAELGEAPRDVRAPLCPGAGELAGGGSTRLPSEGMRSRMGAVPGAGTDSRKACFSRAPTSSHPFVLPFRQFTEPVRLLACFGHPGKQRPALVLGCRLHHGRGF